MSRVFVIFAGNERGGAATHITAFANALRDGGVSSRFVFVAIGDGSLQTSIVEVGVDNLITLPVHPVKTLQRLVKLMRSEPVTTLWHAHGPRMNVLTNLAATLTGRRWTTTIHSDVMNDFLGSHWKSLFLTRLHLWSLRHVAGAFVGNPEFQRFLPKSSVFYVPNAVQPHPLQSPKEAYQRQLRESLGIPEHAKLIGTAARFDPVKNIPMTLEAFAQLRDVDAHFVIAGDGPQKEDLLSLVASLDIESRVHFVGFIPNVISFYAGLDVHVLASRSEGASPFAILEAGSCDTVNIGSDIPGIRNLIEPNVTGACFPSGDVPRLAAEMGRLLTDSSLRSTFVEAFRARVLPNYTASAMLEGYLQGYTQMMLDSWVTSRE